MGWDGKVICTSIDSGITELVTTFETSARWLSGRGGRCFVAVSNGAIYDLRSPNFPIYEHDREPYRLAISPDITRMASTDWGGQVKIWDLVQARITATLPQLHNGLVVNAIWLDDNSLVTAGHDGFVHLLDGGLVIKQTWRLGAPIRYLAATGKVVSAALADGTLSIISLPDGAHHTLPLDVAFNALAVSPDGESIAVGTEDDELLVIDKQHRITAYHFPPGGVGSVTFENNRSIICTSDNRLMRIKLQPVQTQEFRHE